MTSCPPAGRYKVTKAALALVGLIRSSLQEACEAGTPAAVQSGCNAVLDMASLLIAVPQGVHGEQLQVSTLCVASALPHSVKSSCRSPPAVTLDKGQLQRCLQRPLYVTMHRRDMACLLIVMPSGIAQGAAACEPHCQDCSGKVPLPASQGGVQLLSNHKLPH